MTHRQRAHKKEFYYREAIREGYRSRASYKLIQIQSKFSIFNPGDYVLDIGAAPGGWSQIATNYVKPSGMVYALDLEYIEPIDNVVTIQGDVTKPETIERLKMIINQPLDVIICDISPKISGNWNTDHARQIYLSEESLKLGISGLLKQGGKFVCKLFQGDLFNDYINNLKQLFTVVYLFKPKASRKGSAEIYAIAKGLIKGSIKKKEKKERDEEK